VKDNGTVKGCPRVHRADEDLFRCAKDVEIYEHVRMQGTIQEHVGNSISKTVNCGSATTSDDIFDLVVDARNLGCKGLTIYREGSRDDVVLENRKESKLDSAAKELVTELERNPIVDLLTQSNGGRILPKTPRDMFGIVAKRTSGCGKLYISIGESNGSPHTVLIKNKGGCTAMTQTVAELTAAMLRWGIPRWELLRILNGIKCDACIRNPNVDGKSCSDIIGKVLGLNFPDEEIPPKTDMTHVVEEEELSPAEDQFFRKRTTCPDCGKGLVFVDGCRNCPTCGWSKCS
jgi:ribonucleoside-diphosphate reductase alpha chain